MVVELAGGACLRLSGRLPVKTVAARVGYSSRSSFSRAFSLRYGTAPSALRTAT